VQENTDKQTQYKSEKVDNLKYSKTKLPSYNSLPGNEVGLFYNAPEPTRAAATSNYPQDELPSKPAHLQRFSRFCADVGSNRPHQCDAVRKINKGISAAWTRT